LHDILKEIKLLFQFEKDASSIRSEMSLSLEVEVGTGVVNIP
jgi:hypothetical protein